MDSFFVAVTTLICGLMFFWYECHDYAMIRKTKYQMLFKNPDPAYISLHIYITYSILPLIIMTLNTKLIIKTKLWHSTVIVRDKIVNTLFHILSRDYAVLWSGPLVDIMLPSIPNICYIIYSVIIVCPNRTSCPCFIMWHIDHLTCVIGINRSIKSLLYKPWIQLFIHFTSVNGCVWCQPHQTLKYNRIWMCYFNINYIFFFTYITLLLILEFWEVHVLIKGSTLVHWNL